MDALLIENPQRAILDLMAKHGWNQSQAARALGISQPVISRVLSNPESGLNRASCKRVLSFLNREAALTSNP